MKRTYFASALLLCIIVGALRHAFNDNLVRIKLLLLAKRIPGKITRLFLLLVAILVAAH